MILHSYSSVIIRMVLQAFCFRAICAWVRDHTLKVC